MAVKGKTGVPAIYVSICLFEPFSAEAGGGGGGYHDIGRGGGPESGTDWTGGPEALVFYLLLLFIARADVTILCIYFI